jgi:uncharacterized membrane protein YGL010W
MRTLEEQITQYAAYHRDRRNIATHFVGVPMIVFSIVLALSVVSLPVPGFPLTLAMVVTLVAALCYLKLDLVLGAAMLVYLAINVVLARECVSMYGATTALWTALTVFVVGWILQFWGHKFEGMKPAFFDDIMGLAIGPLFMMTEVFFALGLKPKLQQYVEARVGPVVARREQQTA